MADFDHEDALDIAARLQAVEQALWGTPRDPASGIVPQVRKMSAQSTYILVGVIVAIITPAVTILLTRAAT